jgi:hypothetical protein
MRQVDVISNSDGFHYLLIGMNSNELAGFSLQLWITHHEARYIDWAESLGMNFITFMGGDLWIHNDDSVKRCNLYGEQKDCIVGIVTNEEPTKVKIFDSLGVHSTGQWEVTDVIIPPSLNYPQGMSSKIPKEQFKKRGGVWQAQFLRNLKTDQSTESVLNSLTGEELKGNEAYLILKNVNNPNGEQVKLFKVDVNLSSSRL